MQARAQVHSALPPQCVYSCVHTCACVRGCVSVCADVKPENIVLEGGTFDGRVFLIDFGGVVGVASAASASQFMSTVIGTYGAWDV